MVCIQPSKSFFLYIKNVWNHSIITVGVGLPDSWMYRGNQGSLLPESDMKIEKEGESFYPAYGFTSLWV